MPRYEVRTIEWLHPDCSDRPHKVRVPMSDAVYRYARYAVAQQACDEHDAKSWADPAFNPFLHGGESLFFQTTLPPGPFCDYLEDSGLDPSVAGEGASNADWVAWYELHRASFTVAQLAAVREAMNLIRFAEVVEVPDAVTKGYVVQELNWTWQDEPAHYADPEGGKFVAVYRSRARADARCAELNAERQAQAEHAGASQFETACRKEATEPHRTAMAETRFFEVVEIDFEAPAGPP